MTLQEAVESYALNLISLGLKVPMTKAGTHEFEDKIQNAFRDFLGDSVVCIYTEGPQNNITITLV